MSGQRGRYLFAYGTLMSTAVGDMGALHRALLAQQSEPIGAASLAGQLYDLGKYPGLIIDQDGASRVHGEVVRLANPRGTLAWLDRYEGVATDSSDAGEYYRTEAPVLLAVGGQLFAESTFIADRSLAHG